MKISEKAAKGVNIDGRRHDDQAKVFAENLANIAQEGARKITIDRSLMKLVKNDTTDSLQFWVRVNHSSQDTGGNKFDAR